MRVVVIAAHPDDELLGCGGTVAALCAAGHSVHSLILAEGETSRQISSITDSTADKTRALATAAEKAAQIVGSAAPVLLGLPDNKLDSIPLLDIVHRIEIILTELQPQILLIHHGNDLNIDHVIAHRAALTAGRPLPGSSVTAIYAFETLSSTEWGSLSQGFPFRPQVYVDISVTLDRKVAALACYHGEMRAFPHPRSETAVRAQAQLRGSQAGLSAAEAFELIWARGKPEAGKSSLCL